MCECVRGNGGRGGRAGVKGENEKIKDSTGGEIERGEAGMARSKDRKRARRMVVRTRRGGKKHELGGRRGMLISDFPFVRSVHLFGKRLFGALFPPYGWMAMDWERDSSL